jgi:hypothetical protein
MASPDTPGRRDTAAGAAARHSAPRAAPLVGHLPQFRRDRLGFLARVAREHGDMVELRLGRYPLHLASHPDSSAKCSSRVNRPTAKAPILQRDRVVLGDGLPTSEGEQHRRQRRLRPTRLGSATVIVRRTVPGGSDVTVEDGQLFVMRPAQ